MPTLTFISRTLAAAFAIALLAAGSASAASMQATVLRVERSHALVHVVTPGHTVRALHFHGRFDRRVVDGERVALRFNGARATRVRPLRRARTLRFYAKVVATRAPLVTVRLGDGSRLRIAASRRVRRARPAGTGSKVVPPGRLRRGQSVIVTIALRRAGRGAVTIELVQPGHGDEDPGLEDPVDGSGDSHLTARGTVTAVDVRGGTLFLRTAAGELRFIAESSVLDGTSTGDAVKVSYSRHADGILVADDVSDDSASSPRDVAGDSSDASRSDGSDSGDAPTAESTGGSTAPITPPARPPTAVRPPTAHRPPTAGRPPTKPPARGGRRAPAGRGIPRSPTRRERSRVRRKHARRASPPQETTFVACANMLPRMPLMKAPATTCPPRKGRVTRLDQLDSQRHG
ncbi:MAG: hypothetical protein NVSMB25_09450 [Thermoleophilaceae bacterium]